MNDKKENYYPNIGQSLGIMGIVILASLVFSPINFLLNHILNEELSTLIYYILVMGVPFGLIHNIRKKSTGIDNYNFSLSSTKIMVLVTIATIAIQTGVSSPIANLIPMPDFMKEIFLEFANQKGIFAFILIVIAAPVLEELIFRGIILDGLLKKHTPTKSIIISSVLFGIVHLNPWQFVTATIIGLFSGWIYYRTRKLSLSILVHMVNNLFAFIGFYFIDGETIMDETLTEMYGGITNLVLIILGAIIIAAISVLALKREFNSLKIDH